MADHRTRGWRSAVAVGLLAGIGWGCGARTGPQPASHDDPLARESDGLTTSTVTSDDGVVLLQVASSGSPSIAREDDVYRLVVPIGAPNPIECAISRDFEPTATMIAQHYAKMAAAPADKRVFTIEPVVLIDRPALYGEIGSARTAGDRAYVVINKFVLFTVAGVQSVLCMHSDLGFRSTFRRVTESVARSLRISGDDKADRLLELIRKRAPTYQEIVVTRAGTTPIGISEERVYRLADGIIVFGRNVKLVRHDNPLMLGGHDGTAIEVTDADGNVGRIQTYDVWTDDGVVRSEKLRDLHHDADGYAVTARDGGAGTTRTWRITDSRPLPGRIRRAAMDREEITGGKRETLSVPAWSGSDENIVWQDLKYDRIPATAGGERQVERSDPETTVLLTYDDAGCWLRTQPKDPSVPMGYHERVFSRGPCAEN